MALDKGGELTISYLQARHGRRMWLQVFSHMYLVHSWQDEDLLKSTGVRQQKLQNWSDASIHNYTVELLDLHVKVDV